MCRLIWLLVVRERKVCTARDNQPACDLYLTDYIRRVVAVNAETDQEPQRCQTSGSLPQNAVLSQCRVVQTVGQGCMQLLYYSPEGTKAVLAC